MSARQWQAEITWPGGAVMLTGVSGETDVDALDAAHDIASRCAGKTSPPEQVSVSKLADPGERDTPEVQ